VLETREGFAAAKAAVDRLPSDERQKLLKGFLETKKRRGLTVSRKWYDLFE
jgi:hypothetical protein